MFKAPVEGRSMKYTRNLQFTFKKAGKKERPGRNMLLGMAGGRLCWVKARRPGTNKGASMPGEK